jgi:hypothetical protein
MIAGRLKGMGYEAGCTVNAVKVTLPQLKISEYVGCPKHPPQPTAVWINPPTLQSLKEELAS